MQEVLQWENRCVVTLPQGVKEDRMLRGRRSATGRCMNVDADDALVHVWDCMDLRAA